MKYLGGKSQVHFRTWMCGSEEEEHAGEVCVLTRSSEGMETFRMTSNCFLGHGLDNRAYAKKEPTKKDGD